MSYKNTKKTETTETKKGPVDEVRVNGCKITVWENETEKGVFHNATFERSYLDGENKWQTSHSYGLTDLLAHRAALDIVIDRMIDARNGDK